MVPQRDGALEGWLHNAAMVKLQTHRAFRSPLAHLALRPPSGCLRHPSPITHHPSTPCISSFVAAMKSSLTFLLACLVSTSHALTLVDGNNLLGHKGTPRSRDIIEAEIAKTPRTVVVWDGYAGQTTTEISESVVRLQNGVSADDYIVEHCVPGGQVVTADRALRRRIPRKVTLTHPVVFWKRYLPRLQKLKGSKEIPNPEVYERQQQQA